MKRRISIFLILCFILTGCTSKNKDNVLMLDLYYTQTCPYCHQMQSSLFKKLKKQYKNIDIVLHDVDVLEEELDYYELCGKYDLDKHSFITPTKLLNFDGQIFEDYEQEVLYPMLVVNDTYLFFGYDTQYDELYMDDIEHLFKGEPLNDGPSSIHRYFISKQTK